MNIFKQLTESQFTNKFKSMSEDSLAEFVMVYSMILNAQAQDSGLKSNARKIAKSVLGPGGFDTFRSSLDDYYNAISALTNKSVGQKFNLTTTYSGLDTAIKNFLTDISQETYNTTKAERHLYAIQKACKLNSNSTISDLRRHAQSWASLTDIEKKIHTERLKSLMTNLYSGSSGVVLSKKLGKEYTTTPKEKSILLPTIIATVGGFAAGRALGKWLAK
jgi:hypothetical protein